MPASVTQSASYSIVDDATRTAGVQGDGLTAPTYRYGLWPAATNKAIQSFPGAAATTNVTKAGDAAATLTKVTDATAPFQGSSTTVWLLDNSAGSTNATASFSGGASAAVHAGSIWSKTTSGTPTLSIQGNAPVNLTGSSGYTRAQMTNTSSNADTLRVTCPAGAAVRFTGAQLETGSIATPLVATNGSTATRSAGRLQFPAGLLNETQGAIAILVYPGWPSSASPIITPVAFNWQSDSNNLFLLYWVVNAWNFERAAGGQAQSASVADAFSAGAPRWLIASWTATQVSLSVAGGAFTTVAGTPHIPSLNPTIAKQDLGTLANTLWLYGDIAGLITMAQGPDTAGIATINAYTAGSIPLPGALPASWGANATWNPSSQWFTVAAPSPVMTCTAQYTGTINAVGVG